MAAGNTYTQIASTTLGSAASSVTFSSIAGTYTDLVLVAMPKITAGSQDLTMQIGNGTVDSATNYSRTLLFGTGSSAGSARTSNASRLDLSYYGYPTSTDFSVSIIQLMNYSNTTTNKTVLVRSNNAATGTEAIVGLWRSTSAVNIITISPAGSTFIAGSTFNLYGITAA